MEVQYALSRQHPLVRREARAAGRLRLLKRGGRAGSAGQHPQGSTCWQHPLAEGLAGSGPLRGGLSGVGPGQLRVLFARLRKPGVGAGRVGSCSRGVPAGRRQKPSTRATHAEHTLKNARARLPLPPGGHPPRGGLLAQLLHRGRPGGRRRQPQTRGRCPALAAPRPRSHVARRRPSRFPLIDPPLPSHTHTHTHSTHAHPHTTSPHTPGVLPPEPACPGGRLLRAQVAHAGARERAGVVPAAAHGPGPAGGGAGAGAQVGVTGWGGGGRGVCVCVRARVFECLSV